MENSRKNYLCHYGIRGQKWGQRRYQNEDGSYTQEGLLRYTQGNGKERSVNNLGAIRSEERSMRRNNRDIYNQYKQASKEADSLARATAGYRDTKDIYDKKQARKVAGIGAGIVGGVAIGTAAAGIGKNAIQKRKESQAAYAKIDKLNEPLGKNANEVIKNARKTKEQSQAAYAKIDKLNEPLGKNANEVIKNARKTKEQSQAKLRKNVASTAAATGAGAAIGGAIGGGLARSIRNKKSENLTRKEAEKAGRSIEDQRAKNLKDYEAARAKANEILANYHNARLDERKRKRS